jgi:hypothetical protein
MGLFVIEGKALGVRSIDLDYALAYVRYIQSTSPKRGNGLELTGMQI